MRGSLPAEATPKLPATLERVAAQRLAEPGPPARSDVKINVSSLSRPDLRATWRHLPGTLRAFRLSERDNSGITYRFVIFATLLRPSGCGNATTQFLTQENLDDEIGVRGSNAGGVGVRMR